MELELKDESCGFRVSVQVGTDLMKQKEPNSAKKKRVDRTHLRDQSRTTLEASC